jgi:hypothetical protein
MRLQLAPLALLLRSSLAAAAADDIKCASGWGQEERVISSEWINDGYCDCPLDGLDEPGTEACSGSVIGGWAGVKSSSDARYVYIFLLSFSRSYYSSSWKHGLTTFLFILPRPLVNHLWAYPLASARHFRLDDDSRLVSQYDTIVSDIII